MLSVLGLGSKQSLPDFVFPPFESLTDKTAKKTDEKSVFFAIAEETGFEPAEGVNPHSLSKRAPSTAQSLLPFLSS